MQQDTMQLDAPAAATPTGITMISLGGSHRAIRKAIGCMIRAGIPHTWLGPINLGSNRHHYAIPTRCMEQVKALSIGATRARDQWEWLAHETEQSYFGGTA